jgi:hypothetical protein
VFALPAACSSSSSNGTGNDAGNFGDSSVPDAGKTHDSGKSHDAGKTHDSGQTPDAFTVHDAGIDTGTLADAGGPDVGTFDGSSLDSGTPCTPGATECTGNNLQTCADGGTWSTPTACPFVCAAGTCSGTCVPQTTQCSAAFYPQTCDSTGTWQGASTCTKDTDCCGNSFCDSSSSKCAATLPSESECTGDDQCASGMCILADAGASICE